MIQTSYLVLATEKTGGLFDLDGTLPLVALQFLVLMFALNVILYTPLLNLIDDRNQYITENLTSASKILAQANQLKSQYTTSITKARKDAQQQTSSAQALFKQNIETELNSAQKSIEQFLSELNNSLAVKKENALTSLNSEIDSLSDQIISKILA
jgi:F-type H+-transporting ATPase subunit b